MRAAVGWAEAGDFKAAEKALAPVPADNPARLLADLEVRSIRGERVAAAAHALAERTGGYGSAWGFAAVSAQREHDLRTALASARRAAELQPEEGWTALASEVEREVIATSLAEGQAMLSRGDAAGALASARRLLSERPETVEARYLAVRALLALHDKKGAAEMVPGLPDTGEGLALKGEVADELGQWDLAFDLFKRLPSSYPGRCQLIETARSRLRLINAPPYATAALGSPRLQRRGLAAIIALEAPALAGRAQGPAPVFEDVVQLPERSDVITAARSGVIPGDPAAHRFDPDRPVSPGDLAATLDRLAKVLDRPSPRWCADGEGDCLRLPQVVTGQTAADLVRRVAGGGGEPCPQR